MQNVLRVEEEAFVGKESKNLSLKMYRELRLISSFHKEKLTGADLGRNGVVIPENKTFL